MQLRALHAQHTRTGIARTVAGSRQATMQHVRHFVKPGASVQTTEAPTTSSTAVDMQERLEWMKQDLPHVFDEQGIDIKQYDAPFRFRDPLSMTRSHGIYAFGLKALHFMFKPNYELHGVRQTGPHELTARWTMVMDFQPAKLLGITRWWHPTVVFTGTSIYGIHPDNGKVYSHVDYWDSINGRQKPFSPEGLWDFLRELLAVRTTPNLEQPHYIVLRRTSEYQVRRYDSFLVAEAPLDGAAAADGTADPAAGGGKAFGALAAYILGKGNVANEAMQMTTPVFTSTEGTMQFVIQPSAHKDAASLPAPTVPDVHCKEVKGGSFAVRVFNGVATKSACMAQHKALLEALRKERLQPKGPGFVLARYNDPSVWPVFRRNEVLVELQDFDVWHEPSHAKQA